MIKDIFFNPDEDKLEAEVFMGGVVVVSYTLRLWSKDQADQKVLLTEIGNNEQTHDDIFELINENNEDEEIINHDGRFVELLCNLVTDKTKTPFSIELKFYQNMQNGDKKNLGSVSKTGNIDKGDNGAIVILGAVLKVNKPK